MLRRRANESYLDGSPLRPRKYNLPHERRWSEHLQEEQPTPDPSMFTGEVTPELKELAQYFWDGYTGARLTKLPAMNGDGQGNLALEQWAIMFQNEMGLTFEEMEELWMYLISIRWATATAFRAWKVRLQRNELYPTRTPTVERKKAPPPLPKPVRARSARSRKAATDVNQFLMGKDVRPKLLLDVIKKEKKTVWFLDCGNKCGQFLRTNVFVGKNREEAIYRIAEQGGWDGHKVLKGNVDEWFKQNGWTLTEVTAEMLEAAMKAKGQQKKTGAPTSRWMIYIPEEGDWPINYSGPSKEEAKRVYLEWAGRRSLPAGAVIWDTQQRAVSPKPRRADGPRRARWMIYIPGEGDWPINYSGPSKEVAEEEYLEWAGRDTLPRGAIIWDTFKQEVSPGLQKYWPWRRRD